jgi:hypothetical protein
MPYAVKYTQDFTGALGGLYRWQILQEDYVGSANTLVSSGRSFMNTTWQMSDDDEYSPLFLSETTLSVMDTDDEDVFDDLVGLLDDNQDGNLWLYIKSMPGDTILWRGFIKRGEVSANEDLGRTVTITAHDGLQLLETIPFASTTTTAFGSIESIYTGRVTYTQLLQKALQGIAQGSGFYITSSMYPRLTGQALVDNGNVQLAATQNPLDHVYVDRREFRLAASSTGFALDQPEPCSNVIRDTLTRWGCIMFQWEGDWHVVQVNKRGDASYRRWAYDYNGANVGSPNYSDITSHVVTFANELHSRTSGVKREVAGYDSVRVDFNHGEYALMKNPGFDFAGIGAAAAQPSDWTVTGQAGTRYENIGKGDGQFISRTIQTSTFSDAPTTTLGTGAGSVDAFVNTYCDDATGTTTAASLYIFGDIDASGSQETDILAGNAISAINVDGSTILSYINAGETIWLKHPAGQYSPVTLTQSLGPGSSVMYFTSTTLVAFIPPTKMVGKASGYASSTSYLSVGSGDRIRLVGNFVGTLQGNNIPTSYGFGFGTSLSQDAFVQVVLTDGVTPYYLSKTSAFQLEWTTTVSWLSFDIIGGDWQVIDEYVYDTTPISGTITVRVGPSIVYGWHVIGSGLRYPFDEVRWDNVDIRPLLAVNEPNVESRSIILASDTQVQPVTRTKQIGVRVSDASVAPWEVGTSLDSDGLIQTEDWEESAITGAASGDEHIRVLARMVLRSTRAPRLLHEASYMSVGQVLGPFHVLSRSGSSYAPFSITVDWEGESTSGSWYKVTESGFTSTETILKQNSAFVQQRGGVGSGVAGMVSKIGGALFEEGSKALTKTTAVIAAGSVSSISVEALAEPVLKVGDLIAIFSPELEYKQVQVKTDQLAGATSIAIADKDNIAIDATFDVEFGYPSSVMFTEHELLTIARLGEQGFAVTVNNQNIGDINATVNSTVTSLAVTNWIASLTSGTSVYLQQADNSFVEVVLSADAPRGSTSISFGSTAINVTSGDDIKSSGTVSRSEFIVTDDRIAAYINREGDQIATVDTNNDSNTTVACTHLAEALNTGDTVYFHAKDDGRVIRRVVASGVSAGAISFTVTSAFTPTDNITDGDPIIPGVLTGLRIDMTGVNIENSHLKNTGSNAWNGVVNDSGTITTPGSQGWIITSAGEAEFSDVTVRGVLEASTINGTVSLGTGSISINSGATLIDSSGISLLGNSTSAGGGTGAVLGIGNTNIYAYTIVSPSEQRFVVHNDSGDIRLSTESTLGSGSSVYNVHVRGSSINLKAVPAVSGGLYLNDLKFPSSDGTVGQALTTDGGGTLSWTTINAEVYKVNTGVGAETALYIPSTTQHATAGAFYGYIEFSLGGTLKKIPLYDIS